MMSGTLTLFPRRYCVEYDSKNVVVGERNFELNNVKATNWTLGFVKEGWLSPYLKESQIPTNMHMMLVDIQGYEEKLIPDLAHAISTGSLKVSYLMVGTHSAKVHNATLRMVASLNWRVVAELDHDATFFYDGMVVATPISEEDGGVPTMKLGDRRRTVHSPGGLYQASLTGEQCEYLPDELEEFFDSLPPEAGLNGKPAN